MAMNLRENKIDEFGHEKEQKRFLGRGAVHEKLAAPEKRKLIDQFSDPKRIALNNDARKNWVRKPPKPHPSEELLDYQEDIEYQREYSQYLQQSPENVLISWRGPEFEHYPNDKKWYTGVLIILSLIILYAVFKGGIIMAIVFALIGLVGYLILSRPQKVIDFAITYDGILVGDEIYDYDDIESFWIFYEPPHTRVISLHMKGHFRPYLHIPLHQVDPVDVHQTLIDFVPEVKQEQNIVDIMERLLRM
jgi:hypothetical protein